MPTIKDIAKRAEVSICTVSRYLNHNIVVRKETEERIEAAIKELGYVPNIVAKQLKQNKTSNVAVILPKINNLYYSEMTAGISEELNKHAFNLFIYEVENLHLGEEEILQTLKENMVAGVIFIGLSYDLSFQESLKKLLEWDIPVVYTNRCFPYDGYPLVYPDFLKVGRLAAEHLMSRGKQRLALVHRAMPDNMLPHHVESFRETLQQAGMGQPVILQTQPGLIPSEECLSRLLRGDINGVFALNEMITVGLVKALSKRGVRIPEDMAVLSFGNSLMGQITMPELSCVDLQNYQLGIRSAEVMVRQIQGERFETVTTLEPFIVQREST